MNVIRIVPEDSREEILEVVPYKADSFDTIPLSHQDFVECVARGRRHYPLTITNAVPLALEGTSEAQPGTLTTQMGLPNALTLFGLVHGGWLPFPFSAKKVVLLDRSVVSHIKTLNIEELKKASDGAHGPLWPYCSFDLAGQKVSPILYVFEGRNRRPPTLQEIASEAQEATTVLQSVLPDAKVLSLGAVQQAALASIIEERAAGLKRRSRLLLEAGALVAQRVAMKRRLKVEAEIVDLCQSHGVPLRSFLTLALLSCLYEDADARGHAAFHPGRAVLKLNPAYSEREAYGALMDLSFLELMLQFPLATPEDEYVFYTRDLGLASLWAALRPRLERDSDGKLIPRFTLDSSLFPGLTEREAAAVGHRLEASTTN